MLKQFFLKNSGGTILPIAGGTRSSCLSRGYWFESVYNSTGILQCHSPACKSLRYGDSPLYGIVFLCVSVSHINLCGSFNAKATLVEQLWYYLTHRKEDKGVHTFPLGICPKVNLKVCLEFELTWYNSAVQRFNHYTTKTTRCFYV